MAMDAACYWQWINDPERKPCDLAPVEAELRKAYRGRPDTPGILKLDFKKRERHARQGSGPASGVRMKGRCARALVDFHKGGEGDARVMSTVLLRGLRNTEDMERDEAVARTHELLGMRPEFREKPVAGSPRLSRMIEDTADAVWKDNGYQAAPLGSLAIWSNVKAA